MTLGAKPPSTVDWADVRSRMDAAIARTASLLAPTSVLKPRQDFREEVVVTDDDAIDAIRFMLSNQGFAIPTSFVCEIVAMIRVGPLPGTPSYLIGVHDLRGQLLPVFDIRGVLPLPEKEGATADWALVVGDEQPEFLILCDTIPEVTRLPREEFHGDISKYPGVNDDLATVAKSSIFALDGRVLLADPRFLLEGGVVGDTSRENTEEIG